MEDNKSFEELEKDFTAIRDENRKCANTAFRIGSALLSLLALSKKTLLQNKEFSEGVTFIKGIIAKAVSYFQGIVNKGDINNNGDITNTGNIDNTGDITNSGNIMTNNLTVTGKATFFELDIQKAKAAGGMSVNSAGSFHIDAVVETPDGFVCYQRAEKDGVKLSQTCEVSDQMMCSNGMNILEGGKGNHFYWRKVTKAPKEVVTHVINGKEEKCLKLVLSKTDHSENTVDIPQVGDDLVQIGNPDNKERQSVMMSCAYNSFDPELKPSYWAHYMGVNDYDISKHRYTWFAANGSQVTGNFKVQSDNGELESIEDYMKGLATNTYKLVMSGSQFNVKADGSLSPEFISIYAYKVQGEFLTQLSPSNNVKVLVTKGENKVPLLNDNKESLAVRSDRWNLWADKDNMPDVFNVELFIKDKLVDKQKLVDMQKIHVVRDGRNGQNGKDGINGEKGTDGKDGANGKDAVSYKLLPLSENALAYITEDKKTKVKTNKVGIRMLYKVMKSAGEQVNFTTLEAEGMTLTIQPSVNKSETFNYDYDIDAYGLSASITYKEIPNDSYKVTLTKGGDIVDQRIVAITFKPKVVFDIDTKNGEIRSDITNVKGDMNSFKATIEGTSNTVGNLEKEFTQMKLTSKEINFTVNNGTRPNLLWGSDLDLSEVQDKIRLAYHNGDVIQQNTAKKEELQRQLDATPTNDTAKRNDLQKKINDCNDKITTARNKVSECKAAIEKHLGVGLASTKIDSEEWFEYMKGGGVAGADAIKFKTLAGVSEYPGLFWEKQTGAKCNIKLKQHTTYTLSAWVKVEFDKEADGYVGFGFEAFKNEDSMTGRKPNNASRLNFNENPAFSNPTDGWIRFVRTFTTDDLNYGSVTMNIYGTKPATLYICRPKLEEGNKATPWCAYDGTTEALLATGLDIKEKKFTATADNFKVQNNRGEQTFFVDEKGRINNGMLVSKLRLTEPTIITNENYREFCYNGKLNGHDVRFLDLLKCGTLLVLTDVKEELYLDLPSFKHFENFNNYTSAAEKAKAQYDKMRYIGNTIILYNIQSKIVSVSGTLKYKRMAGVKDMNYLDEFGFYTKEMLPCRGGELACFECKFGITRPEGNGTWDERRSGVYWEYCYVTIR